MAENKPVVESIKIGTLEKQIEILEQLGLTKSEITNLIYDTQGQITAENTDTLDIIIQQFAKILEHDELKTIEELAKTLLANQSEASVKYVLEHELVGKVFKHILKSDNDDFDEKNIDEIIGAPELFKLVHDNASLHTILFNSTAFHVILVESPGFESTLQNQDIVNTYAKKPNIIKEMSKHPKYALSIVDNNNAFTTFINSEIAMNQFANTLPYMNTWANNMSALTQISQSEVAMNALDKSKYRDMQTRKNFRRSGRVLLLSTREPYGKTEFLDVKFEDGSTAKEVSYHPGTNLLNIYPKVATYLDVRVEEEGTSGGVIYYILD